MSDLYVDPAQLHFAFLSEMMTVANVSNDDDEYGDARSAYLAGGEL